MYESLASKRTQHERAHNSLYSIQHWRLKVLYEDTQIEQDRALNGGLGAQDRMDWHWDWHWRLWVSDLDLKAIST